MQLREIAASLYPWDLLDEGTGQVLDVLQRETRTNSVYLVGLMHDEKRPLTDFYFPHNPQRKVYWTEDSRAYWNPNPESYANSRIAPRVSDRAELNARDWLQELIDAGRARGMTVGVELSHTWIDKERCRTELADCVQRNIYGEPFDQQMCFNNPDVRAYARALYLDLARHYDIDYIMTCVRGFNPGTFPNAPAVAEEDLRRVTAVSLGGCFCEHCEARAIGQGIDWEGVKRCARWLADGLRHDRHESTFDVQLLSNSSMSSSALLIEQPELYAFLEFRAASLTDFFSELKAAARSVSPTLDLRLNHYSGHPELMGLDLRAVSAHIDSVRSSNYSEQTGETGRMEDKRQYLHSIRHAIGLDTYMLSAVSPRPKATPELVEAGVRISAECGADALTIGHYDGAWLDCLRAIRTGLDKADIEIVGK